MVKRLAIALVIALVPVIVPLGNAQAAGTLTASVSIPGVRYNGTGNCINAPVTLNVSGGVSNGFAYWTTENETLSGPTSSPSAPGFFFDNEDAPGTETMSMCPYADHPGVYTYSADVWFHNWSDEGGDQYVGRVSGRFSVSLAASTIVKIARHKWQVKIVGQPYLVSYPNVRLQKLSSGKWRTISRVQGNSAGKLVLRARPYGKYRLVYRGSIDLGLRGSTSKIFRRP